MFNIKIYEIIMESDFRIFKALSQRLKDRRDGDERRKRFAKILNKHYLTNGNGHQLFKQLAISESNNPKKEKKNGESE